MALNNNPTVLFPFGAADSQTPVFAATQAVVLTNSLTFLDLGTLTGACTVNLTIPADMPKGARIHLKAKSDGTARDTTFGTGFTSPVLAGVISKTKVQEFIYNGTTFLPCGAGLQID